MRLVTYSRDGSIYCGVMSDSGIVDITANREGEQPSGVAMATGHWLKPGDVIECKIEGLGSLTNTVGPKPAGFYEPLA